MAAKESYRDRQESELEVLKSIFNEDVTDLRPTQDKWIPLDIKIDLMPQKDSKVSPAFCGISLHLICPKNYPKVTPKILLENAKGLTNDDVLKLMNQLTKEAYSLKGEVMAFELCQFVQGFLHEQNKQTKLKETPVSESFYDTMLKNKQIQDQKKQDEIDERERKKKEQLQNDILKRKEQLLKETRVRRSTVSESSPRHLSSSNSEDSRNNVEVCDEHRKSETFFIAATGRKIQLGACLGHSQKGCINYPGIDLATGKLLYITEWNIKISQLESRNLAVDQVISEVESKVNDLSKLRHNNLIGYECVLCAKKKDMLQVFLVQEFLLGISVFSISEGLGWSSECSLVAKGVLKALIFLHNNGVSHGNLLDSTVFMDSSGTIKVTDFSIVPYLLELISGEQQTADLPSLGTLIESLIPTPHLDMRDFITRCKSETTLSGSELLDHPFLYSTLVEMNSQSLNEKKQFCNYPPPVERPQSAINSAAPFLASLRSSDHSRLQTEFEILKKIGKGAYGDVLKVQNILDKRQYAIKRIPLSSKNKQLYKKVTREVELLSKLNHENVVRYCTSWIETHTAPIEETDDEDDDSDFSLSQKKSNAMVKTHSKIRGQIQLAAPGEDDSSDDDSFSPEWDKFIGNPGDDSDSDDGIEFVDSQGQVVKYDEESSASAKKEIGKGDELVVKKSVFLYIQMEFCEKSTLRTAIDGNLYKDKERLWKLFREIVEGLSHIHEQGMIHRDLKPVNIFLDSKDHVKIGDFGLATTSVLALSQHQQNNLNQSLKPQLNFGDSQTGQVGTALYVAPELSGIASKSTYSQKVDIYSLGIIFFEMCTPPLNTGMERIKTIAAIRQPEVNLPKEMLLDEELGNEVKLLKWLLDHNPNNRPKSEELLQSELLPPPKLEFAELQEMLRHVLANSQSKVYKLLISKCLMQESDFATCVTYHTGMVKNLHITSSLFENVKNKIVQILRKHGAIDVSTPLLTPYTKVTSSDTTVRLMCNSGSVVTLPHDLRQPFLRHVALNGVTFLRRYSIGRIYQEKKSQNFHPRQKFECVFDIVTPHRGNFLVDAELLYTANEIVNEFDELKQKNITFRINHTSLLRAILLYYSIPKDKYNDLFLLVAGYHEGKLTKLNVKDALKTLLPGKDQVLDMLLMTDCPITSVNSTMLKMLIKGRGEAPALAKGAIRELESVINLSKAIGVNIPVNLCVGLSFVNCMKTSSIIWQMIGEMKPGKLAVFAMGGRHDNMIEDYKKTAQRSGFVFTVREMYSAGFSLDIDKLVLCLSQHKDSNYHRAVVDLVVYVTGNRPPLKEVTQILKSLWNAGIKCCFIEAPNSRNDEDIWAQDLGANYIVLLGEDGCLRVKSWTSDRYSEKNVTRIEIIEYLKRNLNANVAAITESFNQNLVLTRNNSISSIANKNYESPISGLPNLDVIFVVNEKLNLNKRKRLENQIEQKLGNVMQKFNKKETFTVFAVELELKQIKSLIGCIDPNPKDQSQSELDAVLEKFPKHKQKYLQEIFDEITEKLAKNKNSSIVGIYSVLDSYYRLIL